MVFFGNTQTVQAQPKMTPEEERRLNRQIGWLVGGSIACVIATIIALIVLAGGGDTATFQECTERVSPDLIAQASPSYCHYVRILHHPFRGDKVTLETVRTNHTYALEAKDMWLAFHVDQVQGDQVHVVFLDAAANSDPPTSAWVSASALGMTDSTTKYGLYNDYESLIRG